MIASIRESEAERLRRAVFQLHLEPGGPIEVTDLTKALGSLARQYQSFAQKEGIAKAGEARLLVSSVSPGSIDINFVPDIVATAQAALPYILPVMDQVDVLTKFGGHIKSLLGLFKTAKAVDDAKNVTIKDCDDAVNIANPIAKNGGSQTFNVFHGPIINPVINVSAEDARDIVQHASQTKRLLQFPEADRRQLVSMVWRRLDRDTTKTAGKDSPDRALISEIDPKARPILFTDEMAYLKPEMMADEDNPYQFVYFVDVEVMLIEDKIAGYRIIGYHGKEILE